MKDNFCCFRHFLPLPGYDCQGRQVKTSKLYWIIISHLLTISVHFCKRCIQIHSFLILVLIEIPNFLSCRISKSGYSTEARKTGSQQDGLWGGGFQPKSCAWVFFISGLIWDINQGSLFNYWYQLKPLPSCIGHYSHYIVPKWWSSRATSSQHLKDDDQVAMCTLAFLELVNEGNIQAQVVAITIILFLFATTTIVLGSHCHPHNNQHSFCQNHLIWL